MILDMHIHVNKVEVDHATLVGKMRAQGVDGGVLLSLPPASMTQIFRSPADAQFRLDNLRAWCGGKGMHGQDGGLYGFYWIDPTEPDAAKQVETAAKAGVAGFKVIANHFYPGDSRAMPTYHAIAEHNKPLLFHSGILWDGTNSSKYNRPAEFEAMLDVPALRFALAHISWPWVDECLAVYGKIINTAARVADKKICQMFIDVTPGTPPIYRSEALTKIFTIGYKVEDNVLFGSDSTTTWYAADWVPPLVARDNAIYDTLGLSAAVREKIYQKNLQRFMGV